MRTSYYKEQLAPFIKPRSEDLTDSHIFDIKSFNASQKDQMLQRHANGDTPIGLFLDLDETVVETVERHVVLLNNHAAQFGIASDQLPTYEQVLHNRGTQYSYNNMFPNIRSDAEFQKFMQRVRRTGFVNSNAPVLHHSLPSQLNKQIEGVAHIIGAITARPGFRRVVQATQQDLFDRVGLQEMPIMFQPPNLDDSQTGSWKRENMLDVAMISPNTLTVLFDDSASTALKNMAYNKQRGTNPPIIQILYEGSLTQSFLSQHDINAHEQWKQDGIYVGNWDNLGVVLNEIATQWLPIQN